jgi:uncharacterized protein (TIGR02646 family)
MLPITRRPLPRSADDYLTGRSASIGDAVAGERAALARRLWRSASSERMAEVRQTLAAMCSGIERCMYCEDSAATDIDHFVPRARAPELAFIWENYLLACSTCNSNYKRSEYPRAGDGGRLLLDPTRDEPAEHLAFSPTTGRYVHIGNSRMAQESIRVFGMNRVVLTKGRRDAWELLQVAIEAYAKTLEEGDSQRAERLKSIVTRQPFGGVLKALVESAAAGSTEFIGPGVVAAIDRHGEIRRWPYGGAFAR